MEGEKVEIKNTDNKMEIKKKGKNRIKERATDTIVVVRFHRLNEHLTGLIIPPGEIITRLNIHNR